MVPVKLGVIGSGAIAQVQHLPNLATLQEKFAVVALCDISAELAAAVAKDFHIPHHFSDHRDILAADIDAVLLCHSDPKTAIALAALEAGKHAFIEKPVCFSPEDADAIITAAAQRNLVAQAGYMKVYDPAFERAKREVDQMENLRFVQINHLHTDNSLHLRQFNLRRAGDDVPPEAGPAVAAARQAALQQAMGTIPPEAARAFFILSGSMIHDLYGLRTAMGQPQRVVSTEIWNEGYGINTVLEYANGARCAATWVELPNLWAFEETLEFYGDDRRVLLSYPTGFSRGVPSNLVIQGIDAEGTSYRSEPALLWEDPFKRELIHFHESITNGAVCRTPMAEARQDIELIIAIVRAYLNR